MGQVLGKTSYILGRWSQTRQAGLLLAKFIQSPNRIEGALAFSRAFVATSIAYLDARAEGKRPTALNISLLFSLNLLMAWTFDRIGSSGPEGGARAIDLGGQVWQQLIRGRNRAFWNDVIDDIVKTGGKNFPPEKVANINARDAYSELLGIAAQSDTLVGIALTSVDQLANAFVQEFGL